MSPARNGTLRFRSTSLGLGTLALASAVLAGVGQWTSSGPAGETIGSFASDAANLSRVFALGANGLLRSNDGGVSWTNVNANPGIDRLAPSATDAVYGLTSRAVGRSDDDGVTWTFSEPNLGGSDNLQFLAADPSSAGSRLYSTSSRLFLATLTGVLRSTDSGRTWEATSGLPVQPITALAISPANTSRVYAVSATDANQFGDLYKSVDAGRNWTFVSTLRQAPTCLAIDPFRPTTLYGCTGSDMMQSRDEGKTWIAALNGYSLTAIAFDPGEPSRVYAASSSGLLRSSDRGTSWAVVGVGPDGGESLRASALAAVGGSPAAVLVAGRNGILRSEDGGGRWTATDSGGRAAIHSIALSPSAPEVVYAGSDAGVFRSANGGASWTPPDVQSPSAGVLAADATNPTIVYAGGIGVAKSLDAGETWTLVCCFPRSLHSEVPGPTTALAVSPLDASVVLAGTLAGTLFRSDNGGGDWLPLGRLPAEDAGYPPVPRSIAFDPSDPSILYVAADGAEYYGAGGFFRSIDGGATWADLGIARSGALAVLVDPQTPATIYLATRADLLESLDAGATWITLHGHGEVLAMDPTQHTTIYSAGQVGVYRSLDAGATWKPLGRPNGLGVTSLAISPDGKRLHAGTDGGVFEYDVTPAEAGPCTPASDSLCLLDGRFRVQVSATDVGRGRTSPGFGVSQGDRFGYFSLPDFTGDATLPEVFVKMVDGTWLPNGSFWVFYNGLTSLPYTLVVTDTTTGAQRVYQNDGFCGGADTSAFPDGTHASTAAVAAALPATTQSASLPATTQSASLPATTQSASLPATTLSASLPATTQSASLPATTLSASGAELSLLGDRFRVALSAEDLAHGRVGQGSAIAQGDRFGYFSLPDFTGDPSLPEVCVKMIDATSFGGSFWFFHTGLTSLRYTLTVTDTVTGAVRTYQNGSDVEARLCGGADTRAFPK